ncbi:MAG TPA: ABC transporter permease [Vicinamibacteria bacterium]
MRSRLLALLRRLALLPRRDRLDRDLEEELRFHLDMSTEAARAGGAGEEEARRTARLRLGSPSLILEDSRAVLGFPRAEALLRDLSLAGRRLRRAPGFTAASVVTLALGIGASSALFALVDAGLRRPLPYPAPERLVSLVETRGASRGAVAPANLADYRVPAFESLAAWHSVEADLSGEGAPETLFGQAVTAEFFAVLGVGPVRGRPFLPAEDREGAERVVIVSDGLWRTAFGSDPGLVGRAIRLDREAHRVVGILPAGFVPPGALGSTRPVSILLPAAFPAALLANRGDHETNVIARLRAGAGVEAARAQIRAVSDRLAADFPDTNGGQSAHVVPLAEDVTRNVRGSLLLLLAAVGAVLAIACLNVANLQMVRALGRRRELAVSAALGASQGRLATGLLVESLLLAGLGGVAGLALAHVLLAGLKALAPVATPRLETAALDARVLGFAVLATVATGLLFGLLPARQAAHARPAESLGTGERQHSSRAVLRWRGALLTVEVALALALMTGAALMVRSVARLNAVELGFETARVVAAQVNLPAAHYPDGARRLAFFEELEQRLAGRPGVESFAFSNRMPLRGGWTTGVLTENDVARPPGEAGETDAQAVSLGYFRTLGIPILRGRSLEPADREGAPYVAVVNEDFARALFPGQEVLGKRVRRGEKAPWITVVGIAASLRRDGRAADLRPQMYLPAAQTSIYPVRLGDLAIRGTGDPSALVALLRREVAALDPEQPVSRVMTLDDALARDLGPRRFGLALLAGFALLALVLTVVGIYGVAAYSVSQRVPELGVRLALGADRSRIVRLVVGDVLGRLALGIALGVVLSLLATRALRGMLFGVAPTDPGTFAAALVVLTLASLAAALRPALRATRIDPVAALRWE